MQNCGDITLVYHPSTVVKGTYRNSKDKRISVNGWKEFMNKNQNLAIGDKLLFRLYLGCVGAFIFVSFIPNMAIE